MNDNRNYDYTDGKFSERNEYQVIADWVTPGAKVIDLACGNGSLMKLLQERKQVECEGLELAPTGVEFCLRHGLKALVAPIDLAESYADYADDQFDYAVCNVTVQMVAYPEVLLDQMKRIAKRQIVSFPNFGYITNRFDLLFRGRMPRPMIFGYDWYSTGHIHHLSVGDFRGFCRERQMTITREHHYGPALGKGRWPVVAQAWSNMFSIVAVFECV